MLKILICDDDTETNKNLHKYIESNIPDIPHEITQYYTGKSILGQTFDILFLDIGLPDGNGLKVAQHLRKNCKWGKIIFVTSYTDYISMAYSVHAFSYITKPFQEENIRRVLLEAMQYLKATPESDLISFQTDEGIVKIPRNELIYFETYNRKIKIVTKMGTYLFREKLSDIYRLYCEHGFECPHNSYVINLFYVSKITGYTIILKNGEPIPLSQKRAVEFKEKFANYLDSHFSIE